jgi:ATP-dependent RNA circularization protein (DNA/RNA ligase family)
MEFIRYPKIHRLGKEETDGILEGICVIQEKVDGANVSIWLDKGDLRCASRSQEITEGFNGFVDYVKTNPLIRKYLDSHPERRLYGEWLVKHSISYYETAYKKFYLFDVTESADGIDGPEIFLLQDLVEVIAKEIEVEYPQIFGIFENPSVEQIKEFVGKTNLGTQGEGVVIKNLEFKNKFAELCYAKIVTENFKESNAIIKHSESYNEVYVMNKYMTLGRVQKIMQKVEATIDGRLGLEHTPRIANTCYHDMLTEEIWEIQVKTHSLNFDVLKRLCTKKAIQIYKDILKINTMF